MENVNGFWRFNEEFDYGRKVGEVRLFQDGEDISGILVFKEWDENKDFIMVRCHLEGSLKGNKLEFKDLKPTLLFGKEGDEYLPENREGVINELGQIVGSTIDAEGISGIFVMERYK
ncbi:hypothetical protein [Natronoflexus pectinivorans]|uniref:Lipocalin-like protein n=1 Tax=Natronoflexus pectinivorans TaxID=682526 RepID=A0A4R2GMA9_9BACT|nr:hypothetical protein [Natronoflexus pectinivorans]TCO09910.1 hypothetical protein EV194_102339 [Natronoflexus pectinivorans]